MTIYIGTQHRYETEKLVEFKIVVRFHKVSRCKNIWCIIFNHYSILKAYNPLDKQLKKTGTSTRWSLVKFAYSRPTKC